MPLLSKKEMLSEIAKCSTDPIYFLINYGKVKDPVKGIVPFELYDFQKDCIKSFKENRFNIWLKTRQIGASTIVAGYVAWLMCFRSAKEIVVVANKKKNAYGFIRKSKLIIKSCPKWLVPKIELDNVGSIALANKSRIEAEATTSDSARSESLSLLIIDEAAAIETNKVDDLWSASYPTLSLGGSGIIISCVVPNTFIFTNKGIKEVDDFSNGKILGEHNIDQYSILGKNTLRRGNIFYNNGKCNTKKIMSTHSMLEGSCEHKLWTYSNEKYEWKKLKDISIGDYIAIQYGMNVWGNNDDVSTFSPSISNKLKNKFLHKKITPDIAYMIGMYIAEGSSYKKFSNNNLIGGTITFTCGDDLNNMFKSVGLKYSNSDGLHYCCSSKNLIEFLEYVGFDLSKKAKEKIIPTRLMEMSKENIAAMLSGIFDGDGFSRTDRGEIGICLSSKRLIEQIRILLNNFGILTLYDESTSGPTKLIPNSITQCYRLTLNGLNSKLFYDLIGFRFERKQNNKQILKFKNLNRSNVNDIIPNSLDMFKFLYEKSGYNTGQLIRNFGLNVNGVVNKKTEYKSKNISRKNVLMMFDLSYEFLSDSEIIEFEKILSENIIWDKIKSIEDGQSETYDFSLPNDENDFWCHSVIYNGIIGHQTPRGVGNFYHKQWVAAENGENDFAKLKVHWTIHPIYSKGTVWTCKDCKFKQDSSDFNNPICDACGKPSLKPSSPWYVDQCRQLGDPRKIAQELDMDFLGSGDNVIRHEYVKQAELNVKSPETIAGFDHNLWIWEEPKENIQYLISADVSRGDGSDYSACHVLKLGGLIVEQIAEYKGKLPPDMYAKLLTELGKEYNNALMVVEANSIGYATCLKIVEMEYPNIFYSMKGQFASRDRKKLEKSMLNTDGLVPGFQTTPSTRPLIITQLEEKIRTDSVIIRSTRTVKEFDTLVWKASGKAEAIAGYNDDLSMALGIGLLVIDTTLNDLIATRESIIASLTNYSKESCSTENMDGFMGNISNRQNNPWVITVGNKQEDLTWLLGKRK